MKMFVFIFSTLISFSALANFTGTWKGQGDLTDGDGNMTACKSMSFDLSQTDTSLKVNSGEADCDLFKMKWNPLAMEINGEDLMSNSVRIGTIAENFLFAAVSEPGSKLTGTYQAEIIDDVMNFKETLVDEDGNIYFSLEGNLTK